jgi:hypothetical protein
MKQPGVMLGETEYPASLDLKRLGDDLEPSADYDSRRLIDSVSDEIESNMLITDVASVPQNESRLGSDSRFKFVYWEHIAANSAEAVAQLADCNVIGLELVGLLSKEEAISWGRSMTTLLSSTATIKERGEALRAVGQYETSCRQESAIIAAFLGTDKRVVALDIRSDDPQYTLNEEANKAADDYEGAAFNDCPSTAVKQYLKDYLSAEAACSIYREDLLETQLDDLARTIDEGSKIGVVMGAAHTPVFHQISRRYPSERVFIGGDEPIHKGQRFRYDAEGTLYRKARFNPNKPISEAELSRVALDKAHPLPHGNRSDGMTDTEVALLLAELDKVKSEALGTDTIIEGKIGEILLRAEQARDRPRG